MRRKSLYQAHSRKRHYRICLRCGCALDLGEGEMCEECMEEMDRIRNYAARWSLTLEQAEELHEMGLIHAG